MRFRFIPWFSSAVATALFSCSAVAGVIEYDLTKVGGSSWRNDYYVTNDTLAGALEEFTIFFRFGEYANLSVGASPADWDSIVAQPDPALPDDGFFDSLALASGIAPGASLSGFSVLFDWLGQGTPESQTFTVVDPNTFETLESGQTIRRSTENPIPEPGTLGLLLAGLLSIRQAFRHRPQTR